MNIKNIISVSLVLLLLSGVGCTSNTNSGVLTDDLSNSKIAPYNAFHSGSIMLDNNGRHINAHGAGFLYDNGRYYMFGEHKLGGKLGNRALVGVHCYSSDDLYNWRDEGVVLKMNDNPESPLFIGTIIERPKVVFNKKTGKYVLWAHLEKRKGPTAKSSKLDVILDEKPDYNTAGVIVATADKITGPYNFVRSMRINAGKYPINCNLENLKKAIAKYKDSDYSKINGWTIKNGKYTTDDLFAKDFKNGQMSRDMTIFVDDNQIAYLITASEGNATLHIHELTDDYTNTTGKFTRNFMLGYHEAPAIFKAKGKYYMFSSHCTGWAPNPGRISVADSMLGEWKELGNPCRGEGQKATKFTQEATAETTFRSQSTYVIKVQGKKDAFIYVGDRWNPADAIDGRYIFLPVEWEGDMPIIKWYDKWDLSFFDKK